MFKKMIALVLCCIMVLPLCSPAVAVSADDDQNQYIHRSMEDILNDYHTKSRQIESQSDAGTNSRSVQTADTVRQDAVSELKTAGYEAYDVNPDTYAGVEAELNTDLSDIGLDPDSSYIIVISGEDTGDNSQNSAGGSSRVITLPPHEYEGGGSSFQYTYNGVTYTMRYVTVTSADNPNYSVSDDEDLLPAYMSSFGSRFFSTAISIIVDEGTKLPLSTVYSLLGLDEPNEFTYGTSALEVEGMASWTFRHIQVWCDGCEAWKTSQTSCYVNAASRISGFVYDAVTNAPKEQNGNLISKTVYSPEYNNNEVCKQHAVMALAYHGIHYDSIEKIELDHEGTAMLTFYEPTP